MNRLLTFFLIIALLFLVGIGGYYTFITHPGQSPATIVSTVIPNLSTLGPNTPVDWREAKTRIQPICQDVTKTEAQDPVYIQKLINAIGGVSVDPTDNSYYATDENQQVSIQPVPKVGTAVNPEGTNCWVVWVGDATGNGHAVYEDTKGNIQKLTITGFPAVPSPIPTP